MPRSLALLAGVILPLPLAAQQLSIPGSALADSVARPAALAQVAAKAAEVYRDSNRVVHLDNLFRLQLLSGRYADAAVAVAEWRLAWATLGDTTARGRAGRTGWRRTGAKWTMTTALALVMGPCAHMKGAILGLQDR